MSIILVCELEIDSETCCQRCPATHSLKNAGANEHRVRWYLPSRRALKSFISQREQVG